LNIWLIYKLFEKHVPKDFKQIQIFNLILLSTNKLIIKLCRYTFVLSEPSTFMGWILIICVLISLHTATLVLGSHYNL